ncbi:hypothetical protein Tco_0629613 [Tanacetum coccineum]|uniref:Uncharacterized protein n=1 Tax=Tanacetum coccineum TaxID=301880 RepID=A0ABQ4WUB4_9ASTR
MFFIVSEPIYVIIYKNSKKEKSVMRHQEVHKFYDATLKRVLEGLKRYNNNVKNGYVTLSLSKEDAEYLQLFEEEIEERLKHRDQMRHWEMHRDSVRNYTPRKSVAPMRNRILVYPDSDEEDEDHSEVDIDNMTLEEYTRYELAMSKDSLDEILDDLFKIWAENIRKMEHEVLNRCDDITDYEDSDQEDGELPNLPTFCATNEFACVCEQDGLPFSEFEIHFTELHLKRITNNHLTLFGEEFGKGSFIENGVMDKDGVIQGSVIDGIRIDSFLKRSNGLINRVHASSLAWNTNFFGKTVERKNDFKVSSDEGNRDSLVDVSSDPNTLVEFENKQRTNLFIDIQKTIKVNGRKDLTNIGVINKDG